MIDNDTFWLGLAIVLVAIKGIVTSYRIDRLDRKIASLEEAAKHGSS